MASLFWKLVVTPLQAQGETCEVVVSAENWLSALRLARKQLDEEGGVPPGASCVMGPTGEVTILDVVSRRRFTLSRTEPAASVAPEPVQSLPQPFVPPQVQALPQPLTAPATPEANVSAPAHAKPRTTMAYSPQESAAIRAQLVAATTQPAKAPSPATPPAQRTPPAQEAARTPIAAQPSPSAQPQPPTAAPQAVQLTAGQLSAVQLTGVPANEHASPTPRSHLGNMTHPAKRSTTVAYSPEESAAIRSQLLAVSPAVTAPAPTANPAIAAKSATVAYMQSPFTPGYVPLVTLSKRDEDPGASSPLLYRERGYFSPNALGSSLAEQALLRELASLRAELPPAQRGVFISLALFDHYFEGKPARGPVATLQWKDWRGAPVFSWNTSAPAPFPTSAAEPVRTSFAPDATATPPTPPAAVVVGRAPTAPAPTPVRSARDSWPASPGGREATGEQDRRLAVAFETVQDLYFLASAAEGMDFAVKLLSELVPSEAVTGCIYDINTDELRFVALTGPGSDERRADAIPAAAGLIGTAAHSVKESLIIADVTTEPRYDPAADGRIGLEARNMLLLPLHKEDNMLGVIQLLNRVKRASFSDADAAVCAYVAGQLAEFLQSKRLSAVRR